MSKQVEMYDNLNRLLKLYCSIQSAAKDLKTSHSKISELIKTGKPYKGKRFKLFHSAGFNTIIEFYPIQQYNKETGEIINQFHTVVEAGYELSYSRNAISRCIEYDISDKFGYYWKKVQKTL